MTRITATQACVALQDAFAAEDVELGDYHAKEVKGWVPENYLNYLQFGVKPTEGGLLEWYVSLSGEGRVTFEEDRWGDHGEHDDHSPKDPEKMYPVIKSAFARLGIDVTKIEMNGYCSHTPCIRYHVCTPVPDWLEAYDQKNTPALPHEGTLVAITFDNRYAVPVYMQEFRSFYMPLPVAESLLHRKDYKGDPVYKGFIENNLSSISRPASSGSASMFMGGNVEKITDFWGKPIEVFRVPKELVELLPRYKTDVDYPVNGQTDPEEIAAEIASQYGEMPWTPAGGPTP